MEAVAAEVWGWNWTRCGVGYNALSGRQQQHIWNRPLPNRLVRHEGGMYKHKCARSYLRLPPCLGRYLPRYLTFGVLSSVTFMITDRLGSQ